MATCPELWSGYPLDVWSVGCIIVPDLSGDGGWVPFARERTDRLQVCRGFSLSFVSPLSSLDLRTFLLVPNP
jgi:hypothetical protein